MAGERTIPLLPCGSIDEIEEFYGALDFTRTYRQLRPNPYLALRRDDIALHFFGMGDFDAANSYGSCLVLVPDIGTVHASFAAGMRTRYGKILASGIPRMTRPRRRKNSGGLTGFSVVDPGGNWIRFTSTNESARPDQVPTESGKLAEALANAVVLGDSKGNTQQAVKILDGALGRHSNSATARARAEALVYRVELAVRLGDVESARHALALIADIDLPADDAAELRGELDFAVEIGANPNESGDTVEVGADGFEPPTARV